MSVIGRLTAALGLAAALSASGAVGQTAPAPIPVGTVAVTTRPVAGALTATGRVEAIDRVEVRARIEGFLDEVAFEEGQTVAAGDTLYRIERGSFEAAVRQAEGALEQARAEKTLADIQLTRAEELLVKRVGTEVARDQARAESQRSAGSVASAEARLATARIELGYTDVLAPVAGRIGRTALTRGAVVSPAAGPLAVIVSQDPMRVVFPISARQFLRRDGEPADPADVRVRLRFADGSFYAHEGRIDFVDVSVDRATDSVIARSTLPNPDGVLIDGQLVTVVLEAGTPVEKPVIPQQALIADQGGVYVFTVEDRLAAVRRVRTGAPVGPDIVIEEGLSAGDLVIVEGVERVRAGAAVLAQPIAGTN
jgi:membrane fusion protein (multidrug efflux system)